jgi:two-component system chemotaxis response regulator CheY
MEQLQINDIVVLLVEPSATQQKIISKQLNEVGIVNIIPKKKGQETLDNLPALNPDVVISALYLPDMTGTDLVHRMRENDETSETGFILISSETRFRYLDPIRQAGVIAILPKPFNPDELRVAMANTLNFIDPSALSLENFSPEEMHVLVVDDSSMARKHIKRVLASIGVEQFTEATDGLEATKILDDQYFDLVVTDYNMPNMDGQELVDHIRRNSTQASVPVLMVTSEENDNRLAAVQKAGVSAICDKPFAADTVRDLIQQILD